MAGRNTTPMRDKAIQISVTAATLATLDRLITETMGPGLTSHELGAARRQYIDSLLTDKAAQFLQDMRRRTDSQIARLTERVEAVETPYLDVAGEVLLLKDEVKNIEAQTIADVLKRLEAIEGK